MASLFYFAVYFFLILSKFGSSLLNSSVQSRTQLMLYNNWRLNIFHSCKQGSCCLLFSQSTSWNHLGKNLQGTLSDLEWDLKDVKIQATNIPNSDGLLQLFPDFCRRLLQKVACLVVEWQRLNDGTSKHVLWVPDLFMPMVAWKSSDKLLSTWILSI